MKRFWILNFGFSIGRFKTREIFSLAFMLLFAFCGSADAQQPTKVPRIGYLTAAYLNPIAARTEAFREGLRELGYIEGKTILIEWRSADGKLDRLPSLANELVRLKVDVIVTGGSAATRPAREATATIPIVMTQDNDPVRTGFVDSLARPGGNITGLTNLRAEVSGKRLELLREIVPRLSRVALFGTSTEPANAQSLKETELTAEAFRMQLQYIDVLSPKDFETAFQAAGDKILKGAKPAELPVEQPSKFDWPSISMQQNRLE